MNVLISRQAAIDAIKKDMYADKDYMSAIICEGIENVLNSLPSAEPERGKWIPCSERLPEKPEGTNEMYLVQYSWGGFAVIGWAEGWNCHYTAEGDVDREHEMSDVIAWMPLPEPYKGAKTEDNDAS